MRQMRMDTYPLISIIIATFNSEKVLPLSLGSIRKQDYPKEKIEILIIDGGSSDNTVHIARSFKCTVIRNPHQEPITAKHIGYIHARGKYVLFHDSDEVVMNENSLRFKVDLFLQNEKIKAVIPSGYQKPVGYSDINYYINEFGDPFSFFIYGLSKDARFFLNTLKRRYKEVAEEKNYIAFTFHAVRPLPIIELVAMSSMVDKEYLQKQFPELQQDQTLIPFLFYLLNSRPVWIAVMKDDPVVHYSSDTVPRYLKKIKSRIKNNIFQTAMGEGGFMGRDRYQPRWFRMKKYLFIPYVFSFILPVYDSLYLAFTRHKPIYLVHVLLCIYTAVLIIYYYLLRVIHMKPAIKSYGQ